MRVLRSSRWKRASQTLFSSRAINGGGTLVSRSSGCAKASLTAYWTLTPMDLTSRQNPHGRPTTPKPSSTSGLHPTTKSSSCLAIAGTFRTPQEQEKTTATALWLDTPTTLILIGMKGLCIFKTGGAIGTFTTKGFDTLESLERFRTYNFHKDQWTSDMQLYTPVIQDSLP